MKISIALLLFGVRNRLYLFFFFLSLQFLSFLFENLFFFSRMFRVFMLLNWAAYPLSTFILSQLLNLLVVWSSGSRLEMCTVHIRTSQLLHPHQISLSIFALKIEKDNFLVYYFRYMFSFFPSRSFPLLSLYNFQKKLYSWFDFNTAYIFLYTSCCCCCCWFLFRFFNSMILTFRQALSAHTHTRKTWKSKGEKLKRMQKWDKIKIYRNKEEQIIKERNEKINNKLIRYQLLDEAFSHISHPILPFLSWFFDFFYRIFL